MSAIPCAQGLGYIPDSQPELQNMLCRWTIAYSRSLMCHLRPGENLEVRRRRAGCQPATTAATQRAVRHTLCGPAHSAAQRSLPAYAYLLTSLPPALAGRSNPQAELKETLPAHELKALLASTHRPNYVVQVGCCGGGAGAAHACARCTCSSRCAHTQAACSRSWSQELHALRGPAPHCRC